MALLVLISPQISYAYIQMSIHYKVHDAEILAEFKEIVRF